MKRFKNPDKILMDSEAFRTKMTYSLPKKFNPSDEMNNRTDKI